MKHYLFLRKLASFGGYGGLDKILLEWFKEIDYTKNRVTLAVNKEKQGLFSERILKNKLSVDVVNFTFSFEEKNFLKVFFEMLSFLIKIKPTVIIYTQGYFTDFSLAHVFAGYWYTKGNIYMSEHIGAPELPPKTTKRHFALVPGFGLWWYKEYYLQKIFYSFRAYLSKKVYAVSNEVKKRLVDFYAYPKNKISVVYHGVDLNKFCRDLKTRQFMRNKNNISEDDTVVISTARLAKQKCLYRLINAFDIVNKDFKNIWLFLLGCGPEENELKELANSKISKSQIKFLGYQEDVSDFLKMSDIFVLPSNYEGFGIALVEAMATGLICVATKTPGPNEIIKNGINGFSVELSDNGIYEGLRKAIFLDPKEKYAISLNARKFAEDNFCLSKNIKEELKIFELQ